MHITLVLIINMITIGIFSRLTFIALLASIAFKSCQAQEQVQQDYGTNLQALKDDFKSMDKNEDGFVDVHELRSAVPGIAEDDITSFYDRYDSDRDGVISLEEYLMVIHNQPQDNQAQASADGQ